MQVLDIEEYAEPKCEYQQASAGSREIIRIAPIQRR